MAKPAKNTICPRCNGDAEDESRFYAKTLPDSSVGAVHRSPGDFASVAFCGQWTSEAARAKVSVAPGAALREQADAP